MRAADTNLLVRIVIRDDRAQAAAADAFIAEGAWVSVVALAEAVWVLKSSYRFQPAQVADAVAGYLGHRSLVVQDADAAAAALELYRRRPALGFTDCLLLELARKAGHLPLGTLDARMGRMPGAHRV